MIHARDFGAAVKCTFDKDPPSDGHMSAGNPTRVGDSRPHLTKAELLSNLSSNVAATSRGYLSLLIRIVIVEAKETAITAVTAVVATGGHPSALPMRAPPSEIAMKTTAVVTTSPKRLIFKSGMPRH